jgi:hypothetical protein
MHHSNSRFISNPLVAPNPALEPGAPFSMFLRFYRNNQRVDKGFDRVARFIVKRESQHHVNG